METTRQVPPAPYTMTMDETLHVLRNPSGIPDDVQRAARLEAADRLEEMTKALMSCP